MTRSISIVEYKVQQTEFFIGKLKEVGFDFFAAQCFTDAFVSAARGVTFAMQSVISDIPSFNDWYKPRQQRLKADPLARFFNEYRVVLTHVGDTVVRAGSCERDPNGDRIVRYYFKLIPDVSSVPSEDVFTACSRYFAALLAVVFEVFGDFKYRLDDRWYFTAENFQQMGKTIEDAEEELGFPRGWTNIGTSGDVSMRWHMLRITQTVGCKINEQFMKYLGKSIDGPDAKTEQAESKF